jgi:uncharacterized membrane protein
MTINKGFGNMLFARARRQEERGAILILSVVGMVLAMIAAGLAIDIGRIAQAARDDQKVADLAALDAARVLPADYAVAAAASAARNGFPTGPGYSVTAIEGVKTNNQCVGSSGAGSVCVTVTSPHTNAFPFLGGRDSVTRTAVAGAGAAIGTVRVGSSLASVSGSLPPMEVLMLNKVFSALTGGSYNINAVGWRGLADSTVTFSALTQALGGVTGNSAFTVGSTNEILNTTFTMNQLLTATANVLNNNGNSSVATNVTGIKNGIQTTATYLSVPLKLYDFFDFGSVVVGNKQDVANMTLNVLELIRGGAVLADGDHFASFNLAAADVIGGAIPGGFTNAKISMGLIEAPQQSFPGPAGKDATNTYYTSAHTSQIRVKIDVTVRVPLTGALTGLLGVVLVPAGTLVNATFSYYLNAGNAHAYLDAIRCGTTSTPTGVDIWGVTDVGTSRFGLVSDTDLRTESTIPVPAPNQTVLSILGIVNVKATGLVTTNIPGHSGIMRTFLPPYTDTSPSQTVPGTMLSLPSLANTSLTTEALVVSLNTGTLITDLVSGINSTGLTFNSSAPGVATTILKPLYDSIGLSFGTADLWAPPVQTCSALSSLGSVTSTNPPVLRG